MESYVERWKREQKEKEQKGVGKNGRSPEREGRTESPEGQRGIRRVALRTWRKQEKIARLYRVTILICQKGITPG